jgi:hypothetical protein
MVVWAGGVAFQWMSRSLHWSILYFFCRIRGLNARPHTAQGFSPVSRQTERCGL